LFIAVDERLKDTFDVRANGGSIRGAIAILTAGSKSANVQRKGN
jgi:hypothetical protein